MKNILVELRKIRKFNRWACFIVIDYLRKYPEDTRPIGEIAFWESTHRRDLVAIAENLSGWPKCECGCGCGDIATTTDDASVPVCDACLEYECEE